MQEGTLPAVHFVGIGGVGMSAIAAVMLDMGYAVSGSDIRPSFRTHRLARSGARVGIGHAPEHLDGAQTVVYNTAIPDNNCELQLARERGLRVLHRAEMLAELTADRQRIAVAGTHGKTTTSAMLSVIFVEAGLSPTFRVGGDIKRYGTNGRLGTGPHAIFEACESDGSFLRFLPCSQVITNIEAEHLDVHGTMEGVVRLFHRFMSGAASDGFIVGCADCPNVARLMASLDRPCITYGLSSNAEYSARVHTINGRGASFELLRGAESLGHVQLAIPGRHNVLNALAALAASSACGIDIERAKRSLSHFTGAVRRFDVIAEAGGVLIVDDYGHHPTEIACTLEAARGGFGGRRIIVVFQPHLYSRTKIFLDRFAEVLARADHVILTDIYAAREAWSGEVSGEDLWRAVSRHAPRVTAEYIPKKEDIAPRLRELARSGDMIITIGAGDVRDVAQELAGLLGG
ncbi:MAG: UDP-N-acetylmuramate--L-alanine ligase [Armatimonadota bacterium]